MILTPSNEEAFPPEHCGGKESWSLILRATAMLHTQSQSLLIQQAEYILVIQNQERVHKRNFIQLVSVVLLVSGSL